MKILWLTWKDKEHPLAGGAEVVSSELGKRLVADGHEVLFVTGGFDGCAPETQIDGYKVVRVGGRVSAYWQTFRYVRKQLRDWPDLVIEEVNTVPYFSKFYLKKPRYLFFHMLSRKIWFHEMFFPLNFVGYVLEPFYLRLLRGDPVVTVSDSTRMDLAHQGFDRSDISIISEGIQISPVQNLTAVQKYTAPTLISLGSMRSMKRTLHQIEAFDIAKLSMPELKLKIAGASEGDYGKQVLQRIQQSPFASDIEYLGRVSQEQKRQLMQRGHVISVTSVKEGWGLIVTEAASQGTPAVVYNVDGLRDSVLHEHTGLITDEHPQHLARAIVHLLRDSSLYRQLQQNAYELSKHITFERSYRDFKETVLS